MSHMVVYLVYSIILASWRTEAISRMSAVADDVHTDELLTLPAGNRTLAVFNRSSGSLISLKDIPSSVEFLSGAQLPLFTLAMTRPSNTGGPLQVHAQEFRSITVIEAVETTLRSEAVNRSVTWEYADHPGVFGCPSCLALQVNATVWFLDSTAVSSADDIGEGEEGLFHFSISIGRTVDPHNGSWAVQGITFPGHEQRASFDDDGDDSNDGWASAPAPASASASGSGAGSGSDALLHPCFEGVLLPSPGSTNAHLGSAGGLASADGESGVRPCGAAQFAARLLYQSQLRSHGGSGGVVAVR